MVLYKGGPLCLSVHQMKDSSVFTEQWTTPSGPLSDTIQACKVYYAQFHSLILFRQAYGMWFHMTNLIIYTMFLASLTAFITSFDHSDIDKYNKHNVTTGDTTAQWNSSYTVCILMVGAAWMYSFTKVPCIKVFNDTNDHNNLVSCQRTLPIWAHLSKS